MKLFPFRAGVTLCITLTALLASCNKENSFNDTPADATSNNSRLAGVVPDDSALVAKVPMITSADFMADNISNYFSQAQSENAKPAGGGSTGRDRTTPNVSFVSPATGATVNSTVNVQVTATDNVGVSSVVLKVDGIVIGTDNLAPYSFSWNTTGLTSGTHTLTATANDAAGNLKISTIQVGYNTPAGADITPPTVAITSPTNGASVSSTVTVAVAASDNIGVSSVGFKVDGVVIGTDNTAPYSISWNTTTVAAGIHSLTATATDAAGNSNSGSIQVTVNTTVISPVPVPSSYQLTTPTPANQAGEGSCVAFAIAYGARSIEQYYRTNATSYEFNSNIFSPEYVYNQTKLSDCGSGTAFTLALNLLKNQGVCTWQAMPYSGTNGCSLQPDGVQTANAAQYKIASYASILNSDEVAIKTMISTKHPVIVNITADNSFIGAGPGFIWKSYSGSGSLPHAVLICGYDDAKHAYKVMSSWGTLWGDGGFSWIDYDFFVQKSSYNTYVIQ